MEGCQRCARAAMLRRRLMARPVTPASGAPGGPGQGLTGMTERVTLLGGTLDAGPVVPAGFRVEAVLPA